MLGMGWYLVKDGQGRPYEHRDQQEVREGAIWGGAFLVEGLQV